MDINISESLDSDASSEKKSASTLLVELALKRYEFGCTEDGQPYAVKPGGHVVRMLAAGRSRSGPNCRRRTTGSTAKPHRNKHSPTRC
jgi:hypothetical protein